MCEYYVKLFGKVDAIRRKYKEKSFVHDLSLFETKSDLGGGGGDFKPKFLLYCKKVL
jgi:hypothetical protein